MSKYGVYNTMQKELADQKHWLSVLESETDKFGTTEKTERNKQETRRQIAMLEEKIRHWDMEVEQGREKPQSMPRTPEGKKSFWDKFNPSKWKIY